MSATRNTTRTVVQVDINSNYNPDMTMKIFRAPKDSFFETKSKFELKTYGHAFYCPQKPEFLKLGVEPKKFESYEKIEIVETIKEPRQQCNLANRVSVTVKTQRV